MIYLVVAALIVLSIHHLRFNRSTYVKCISLYLFSLSMLIFFSLLQIIKTANYHPSSYIDYYLLLLFSRPAFYYSGISAMTVFCFALVTYSVYLMGIFSVEIKKKLQCAVAGSIPLLFFVFLNHPNTSYNIYLHICKKGYPTAIVEGYLLIFNAVFLMLYLLSPYVILFHYFKRTKYYVKKRNYVLISATILTSEIIIALLFIFGPLYDIFKANISLMKISYPSSSSNLSLLIIICVLLAVMLLTTIGIKKLPFIASRLGSYPSLMPGRTLSQNLRMTLHAYKNFFFAIEKLSYIQKQYIAQGDMKKALEINDMIETMSHDNVTTLCGQLNMLRDLQISPKLIRLSDAVFASAKKSAVSENISFNITDTAQSLYIIADSMHIEEAFVNLITNAVTAVESKHKGEGGRIDVEISSEDGWSCVRICDNGDGISKKNKRKIFNMLFSTKQTNGNFGVGLYYVKRVILAHNGYVHVKSKENEYTIFEVFIPTVIKK